MKLKNLFFMGLASAFIFAGCEEKEDFGPAEISINPSGSIEIPMAGGDDNVVTIELKATIDWALRGYDENVREWLSISPESGKASKSTQTITIKALKNEGANRSATITFYGNIVNQASLTITQKGEKGEAGTAENPFTVSDAIAFIDEGGYSGNENVSEEVYVIGKISEIEESYNPSYNSAIYFITDGTKTLKVYAGKYVGGLPFNKEGLIEITDEVVVCGKLTNFNGTYEFTNGNYIYSLNGETEVEVDQTVPGGPWIYSNSFVGGIGDFTIDNKQIDEALSYVWSHDLSYSCMKASAYKDGTNYATESWLISPVIDLTSETSAYLTFEHATHKFSDISVVDEEATVWIKEEGADAWTQVTGVTYPSSLGWSFVDAGDIDISAYANKKIQIAFKYTSTATTSGTWEVKNVVVKKEVDKPEGDVVFNLGSATQTWTSVTDDAYGAGYETTAENITVGYYKYQYNNAPRDPSQDGDHIRVYKASALRVKADKAMSKIILHCTTAENCKTLTALEGSGTYTVDASAKTITWTGNATEIVAASNEAQTRFNKIAVVYAE